MFKFISLLCMVCLLCSTRIMAEEMKEISILYLKQYIERPPVLSNLEEIPADTGLLGARLAIMDSNRTGRFTGQLFSLQEVLIEAHKSPQLAIDEIKKTQHDLIILDLPAETLQAVIKADLNQSVLVFNVSVMDDLFRTRLCTKNLLHTLPSRAMLGDALTQYLVKKRWTDWMLIEGPLPGDKLFAEAMRHSAKKFGAKIVDEKIWDGGRDARRTAQAEVPGLTQGVDYDVLVVADEWGDFGEYLMYRTWEPQLVVGTQGLFATGWFWTIEQWGATQLQRRFREIAKRRMGPIDYAAWVAVRSISESATRTRSADVNHISKYMQSPEFEGAAYKGRKLSFRPWSGQLRQPVAVTAARSLVTQSPQEGFLHRFSELDTLGFDQPEVNCVRN